MFFSFEVDFFQSKGSCANDKDKKGNKKRSFQKHENWLIPERQVFLIKEDEKEQKEKKRKKWKIIFKKHKIESWHFKKFIFNWFLNLTNKTFSSVSWQKEDHLKMWSLWFLNQFPIKREIKVFLTSSGGFFIDEKQ